MNELSCPYCNFTGELCDFPDFFYEEGDDNALNEQLKILQEIQELGYNVVTCGHCGDVFLHRSPACNS